MKVYECLKPENVHETERNVRERLNAYVQTTLDNKEIPLELKNFIDEEIPAYIERIRRIEPSESSYSDQLNNILMDVLKSVPYFLYTEHSEYFKAAIGIVFHTSSPFYVSTSNSLFSLISSTSPNLTKNIRTLARSQFLEKACNVPSNPLPHLEVLSSILEVLPLLEEYIDETEVNRFITNLLSVLTNCINSLEEKDVRDFNDKMMIQLLNRFQGFTPKYEDEVNALQFHLAFMFLSSDYVTKQYQALQLLRYSNILNNERLEDLSKSNAVKKVLANMRDDLEPAFIWLLTELVKAGFETVQTVIECWETANSNRVQVKEGVPSAWLNLLKALPDAHEFFLFVTSHLPNAKKSSSILEKIVSVASEEDKEALFDIIYQMEEFPSTTLCSFIPQDQSIRTALLRRALDDLQTNSHALVLSVCLITQQNEASAKETLEYLLALPPSKELVNLLGAVFQRIYGPLSEVEFDAIKQLLVQFDLQTVYELIQSLISANKEEFISKDMLLDLFDTLHLRSPELALLLFKRANEIKISNFTGKTLDDFDGLELLWESLKMDDFTGIDHFLVHLYVECKALEQLIVEATKEPISPGQLSVISLVLKQQTGVFIPTSEILEKCDDRCDEASLELFNDMPLTSAERQFFDEPVWDSFFDKKQIRLYHDMCSLRKLLSTGYNRKFCASGGLKFFLTQILSSNTSDTFFEVIKQSIYTHEAEEIIQDVFDSPEFLIDYLLTHLSHEQELLRLLFVSLKGESIEGFGNAQELLRKYAFVTDEIVKKFVYDILRNCSLEYQNDLFWELIEESNNLYCSDFFSHYIKFFGVFKNAADDWDRLIDLYHHLFTGASSERPFVQGITSIMSVFYKNAQVKPEMTDQIKDILNKAIRIHHTPVINFLKQFIIGNPKTAEIVERLKELHQIVNLDEPTYDIEKATPLFHGIKNLGATCYMNSALQQLFFIPEFTSKLLSTEVPADSWAFQLQLLFMKLLASPAPTVDSTPFAKTWIGFDQRVINPAQQQDVAEFIQLLLDGLDKFVPNISSIFRGVLSHNIVGDSVTFSQPSKEEFITLGLEVGSFKNLEESFDSLFLPDHFCGQEQYHAEELGFIDATRHHSISHPPTILIVQLKRFSFDLRLGVKSKISSPLEFPEELHLGYLEDPSMSEVVYQIQGVIVHAGSAQFGHYHSYVKTHNEWIDCNDVNVTFSHYSKAFSNDTPYILFYRLKETPTELNVVPDLQRAFEEESNRVFYHALTLSNAYAGFIQKLVDIADDKSLLMDFFVNCCLDNTDLGNVSSLQEFCNNFEFVDWFLVQHSYHMKALLYNRNKITRKFYSTLLCQSIESASPIACMDLLEFLCEHIKELPKHWRSLDSYFTPFLKWESLSGNNPQQLVPLLIDLLCKDIPQYAADHANSVNFNEINMDGVFCILLVLLPGNPECCEYIKAQMCEEAFIENWFQSKYHSLSLAKLYRTFIGSSDCGNGFTGFIVKNSASMPPSATAGHLTLTLASNHKEATEAILQHVFTSSESFIIDFLSVLQSIGEEEYRSCMPLFKHNKAVEFFMFSESKMVRRCFKDLTKSVLANDEDEIRQFALFLIESLPKVGELAISRKRAFFLDITSTDINDGIPTEDTVELIKWCLVQGKCSELLVIKASDITQSLIIHNRLRLRVNSPRDSIFSLLKSIKNQSNLFFQEVSAKRFLTAFSQMSYEIQVLEENFAITMDVLNFVPPNSALIESELFKRAVMHLPFAEKLLSDQIYNFILRIVAKSNAIYIGKALMTAQNFRRALALRKTRFFALASHLLLTYPETSEVFAAGDTKTFVKDSINEYSPILFELVVTLRNFTEGFCSINYGKRKFFYIISRMKPLSNFWNDSKDTLKLLVSILFSRREDLNLSAAILSLLRAVCFVKRSLIADIAGFIKEHLPDLALTPSQVQEDLVYTVDCLSQLSLKNRRSRIPNALVELKTSLE